jgi:hypothetical protein
MPDQPIDDYQIDIPQSFVALFVDPGRSKPNAPRDVVVSRYELCEDLATLLTQTALDLQFSLSITQAEVLHRCHQGLVGDAGVVSPPEAQWVVCRLAELINWDQPVFEAPLASTP